MKILVIGDFHGKFPEKLKNKLKKKNFDLVVGLGDYFPFGARKLFFKHCYGTDLDVWEVIGKKKYKEIELNDRKQGLKLLKFLDKHYPNTIAITGNIDRTKWKEAHRQYDKPSSKKWAWAEKESFSKIRKNLKNIKFFDWSFVKVGGYVFVGYPQSNFPGHIQSKEYRKQKKKLDRLFKRFKKENDDGKLIFVSHNVPYKTKLDIIKPKIKYKVIKRENYGSKLARRIIEKYKPRLVLCGHIHENPGIDKIGKSLIVNSGAAQDGRAAIIDLPEKKKEKIKIKFIK